MTRDEKFEAYVKDDLMNNRGRLVDSCEELDYLLQHPEVNHILQKHYLNDILTYATTFSEYYKQYNDYSSLKDFPIVNKQFLKDHWNDIAVREYLQFADTREKFTSGSTGTPFKMVMDRYKHCRWIAGNKVFRNNVGVRSHEKTVFVSDAMTDKDIPVERQDRDNVYYFDCKYLDDDSLNNFLKKIIDMGTRSLTSMATVLDHIASLVRRGKAVSYEDEMLAVFSVSETLKRSTRQTISQYFRCPVYVLYANEENGVLGVEDGSGKGCRANDVDFYFEVLSMDSDEPAKEGELGRLVITDLFNKAFPVIRYENGDLVSIEKDNQGRTYISQIAGRKIDTLYTTDGRMVHYFNGIYFLESFMDIKQFQLIQYDYDKFKWILNTKNHDHENYILEESRKLFGKDAEFEFEYVDEIPKLRSGKSRMTVCLIPEKITNKRLK